MELIIDKKDKISTDEYVEFLRSLTEEQQKLVGIFISGAIFGRDALNKINNEKAS